MGFPDFTESFQHVMYVSKTCRDSRVGCRAPANTTGRNVASIRLLGVLYYNTYSRIRVPTTSYLYVRTSRDLLCTTPNGSRLRIEKLSL
jgi:hypothetical protein